MIRTVTLAIVLAAAAISFPGASTAQSWPGVVVTNTNTPGGAPQPVVLRGDEVVNIRCLAPCTRSDNTTSLNASILLFASALDIDRAREFSVSRADASAAMAGALDFQAPANGASNRIGAQAFTTGDETAVGLSYSREMGAYDFGLGVSSVGERSAGKVSVGFSW
ncbi:hypothetical protein [Brevundimonas sp. TWP2-3-4b1]|uniref:hypothetical protein n=1 Tax=Brevundimonas sp. TWP2-3-4b1 TaxID=2804580 RepID=UPI003CEDB5B2